MFYRPVNNAFLDECNLYAFWVSKEGIERDFPGSEVKEYSDEDMTNYLKSLGHSTEEIAILDLDLYS